MTEHEYKMVHSLLHRASKLLEEGSRANVLQVAVVKCQAAKIILDSLMATVSSCNRTPVEF